MLCRFWIVPLGFPGRFLGQPHASYLGAHPEPWLVVSEGAHPLTAPQSQPFLAFALLHAMLSVGPVTSPGRGVPPDMGGWMRASFYFPIRPHFLGLFPTPCQLRGVSSHWNAGHRCQVLRLGCSCIRFIGYGYSSGALMVEAGSRLALRRQKLEASVLHGMRPQSWVSTPTCTSVPFFVMVSYLLTELS